MRWCSALSEERDLVAAVREAGAALRRGLGGGEPHLVLAFVSERYRDAYGDLPSLVGCEFGRALIVGCSASGVIGAGREVEGAGALSLTGAVLPGVSLHPFHVDLDELPDAAAEPGVWRRRIGVDVEGVGGILLLADPYSFDVERLLAGLDRAFPGLPKIGGMASGGSAPGENALYAGTRPYRSGAVGLALAGAVRLEPIVAQGCRPIGAPMFVTACRENVLLELDGQPPLAVLQDLYARLDARDRDLCRRSLLLGVEMQAARAAYGPGDFLIRNLLGSDRRRGAHRVGAVLREKQVVQFHVRDARTSAEDLERRLGACARALGGRAPGGAILFSCLGRGESLYGRPGHDSEALRRSLGEVPLGGFFCNGEIGPVQGRTFLHGYTSAFALFLADRSDQSM